MKLVVKECGEPAHGTAEYALVFDAWLETNPTQEHVQRWADRLNTVLEEHRYDKRLSL